MQQLFIAAQAGLPAASQGTASYKAQAVRQEAQAADKGASFDAKLNQAKEESLAPKQQQGAQIKDAQTGDPGGSGPGEAAAAQAQPKGNQEEAPEDAASEAALWIGAPAVVMLTQIAQAPQEGEGAAMDTAEQATAPATDAPTAQIPVQEAPQTPRQGEAAPGFGQVLEAQRQEGMSILQRPAAEAAETNPLPEPQVNAATDTGFTDESVQAAKAVVEEALARMPNAQQEITKSDAGQDIGPSSSLENEHTPDQKPLSDAEIAPPPSRVEITASASRREAGSGDANDAFSEEGAPESAPKADSAIAAQGARFALQPDAANAPAQQAPEASAPAPGMQIVEEAQIQQAMGRTDFTMRLKPESLGEVTVRLTVIGDEVTARIITRTESARAAIAGELATLGDAMRERGIDVRAVQVVDGSMEQASLLHDGSSGRSREQGRQQPRRRAAAPAEAAAAMEITQGYDLYSTDGLSDIAGVEINA